MNVLDDIGFDEQFGRPQVSLSDLGLIDRAVHAIVRGTTVHEQDLAVTLIRAKPQRIRMSMLDRRRQYPRDRNCRVRYPSLSSGTRMSITEKAYSGLCV